MQPEFTGVETIIFDLAIQGAKELITQESKRYEASSETSLRVPEPFPGTDGTLLIVTRSYAPHEGSKLPAVSSQTNALATQLQSRLASLGLEISGGSPAGVAQSWAAQHHLTNELSFCALVLADHITNAMDLTLLGYTYPGLKAKNCAFPIPFTTWNKTKTVFTIGVEGLAGYGSIAYAANESFSSKLVVWPRNASDERAISWSPKTNIVGSVFGDEGTSRRVAYSSKLLSIPEGPVQIDAALIESSDMEKTLASLAKEAGGLKLSDFK
jgi:hypothetical protein